MCPSDIIRKFLLIAPEILMLTVTFDLVLEMANEGDRHYPPPRNNFERMANLIYDAIDYPITWFREKVVVPNRKPYPYYHRKLGRCPEIDQCWEAEAACVHEANGQFKREKKIDAEICNILRKRKEDCYLYEYPDHHVKCADLLETYEQAAENYFIRYGDLGVYGNVIDAFMKQKHRLIWERRHPKNQKEQITPD